VIYVKRKEGKKGERGGRERGEREGGREGRREREEGGREEGRERGEGGREKGGREEGKKRREEGREKETVLPTSSRTQCVLDSGSIPVSQRFQSLASKSPLPTFIPN
jgi:hypothetical protein